MFKKFFYAALFLMFFLLFGYITNISKLIKCDFASPYKAEIIRGVGIVIVPAGCFLGYVNIKD